MRFHPGKFYACWRGEERSIGGAGRVPGKGHRWEKRAGISAYRTWASEGLVGGVGLALEEGREEGRGSLRAGAPLYLRSHSHATD